LSAAVEVERRAAYPPGPRPARHLFDELAQLRDLQRDVLGTAGHRFAMYGDVYHAHARNLDLYATYHPDNVHQVLVTDARAYHKRKTNLELLGDGLLTADGEAWRRQRRRIQPFFRHESIARYAESMAEEVETLAEKLAERESIELRGTMMELTLRVVCRALFGQHFGGRTSEVARALRFLQNQVLRPLPLPSWVPTPANLLERYMRGVIDRQVYAIIDRGGEAGSLLRELRTATDEQGQMSREQLRDEIVTLFLAGHETTALALTWSIYLLSLHPEVERELAREVRAVCGTARVGAPDLERLDLCQRVLKESMRLYPPAYVIPRVAVEPTTLAGYPVAPGSEVWLWIYFMHHDPRWFRLPERFDPDRFLPGGEIAEHPRAFLPFGAGTRSCVGQNFAMLEAVIILSSLIRRFRFSPLNGRALRPLPRITLAPSRPIRVELAARR
jgi:cytochrome P450